MEYVQEADYSRYHYRNTHDLVLSVISARIHLSFCEQLMTQMRQACDGSQAAERIVSHSLFRWELLSVLSFFREYLPDYVLTIDRAKVHLGKYWGNLSYARMRAKYDGLIRGEDIVSHLDNFSSWLRLFTVLQAESEELYKCVHSSCSEITSFQFSLSYTHATLDSVQRVGISCDQSATLESEVA